MREMVVPTVLQRERSILLLGDCVRSLSETRRGRTSHSASYAPVNFTCSIASVRIARLLSAKKKTPCPAQLPDQRLSFKRLLGHGRNPPLSCRAGKAGASNDCATHLTRRSCRRYRRDDVGGRVFVAIQETSERLFSATKRQHQCLSFNGQETIAQRRFVALRCPTV